MLHHSSTAAKAAGLVEGGLTISFRRLTVYLSLYLYVVIVLYVSLCDTLYSYMVYICRPLLLVTHQRIHNMLDAKLLEIRVCLAYTNKVDGKARNAGCRE